MVTIQGGNKQISRAKPSQKTKYSKHFSREIVCLWRCAQNVVDKNITADLSNLVDFFFFLLFLVSLTAIWMNLLPEEQQCKYIIFQFFFISSLPNNVHISHLKNMNQFSPLGRLFRFLVCLCLLLLHKYRRNYWNGR